MITTFFDYIGISDMERIHSATIAWMVSDFCKALSIESRIKLLNTLFGTTRDDIVSIKTIPEYNHVDIAFISSNKEGVKELWLLENKVKAPLGYKQLSKYKKEQTDKEYANVYYSVLSLMGVLPQDSTNGWHVAYYSELLQTLNSILDSDRIKEPQHGSIITEYRDCLSNLVKALSEFLKDPQKYTNVFTDGNKPKASKSSYYASGIKAYIAKNSLETLFQKAYFTEIVKEIIGRNKDIKLKGCHVGESHGNADIGFDFGSFGNDTTYLFDLSFQYGAFKLAVAKEKYPPRPKKGSRGYIELEKWAKALETIKKDPQYKYNRINPPKSRARVSISYNLGKESGDAWYNMDRNKFIDLVTNEIITAIHIAERITQAKEVSNTQN